MYKKLFVSLLFLCLLPSVFAGWVRLDNVFVTTSSSDMIIDSNLNMLLYNITNVTSITDSSGAGYCTETNGLCNGSGNFTSWNIAVNAASSTNVLDGDTVRFVQGTGISVSRVGKNVTITNTATGGSYDMNFTGDSGGGVIIDSDVFSVVGAGTVSTSASGTSLTITGSAHTTDTNAGTVCGSGEFLNGDGSCDTGFLDSDGVDSDTTYSNLSEFIDDLGDRGYTSLSNFTNDPGYSTGAHTTDTNTHVTAIGPYLYNDSTTITLNETKLNATIDSRDSDTTYSAGTGLNLATVTFSILVGYRMPQGCNNGEIAEYNTSSGGWDCAIDNSAASGMSNWVLAVTGIGGSETVTDGETVTFESSDNYVELTRTTNNVYITINETILNNTIDARDSDTTYSNLSEFIDDLGDRGYTSLSNFTNDNNYINGSLIINTIPKAISANELVDSSITDDGATVTISGTLDVNNNPIINVNYFDMNTTAGAVHQEGRVRWSDDDKTVLIDTNEVNISVVVGQEQHLIGRNNLGYTINKSQLVRVNGAQGNKPTVALAQGNNESGSTGTIALAHHDCNDGSNCIFVTNGVLEGVDTSSFSAGQLLFLSATTPGEITNVEPEAPNHAVRIGYALNSNVDGNILVRIINGFELYELHDVHYINTLSDGQVIRYNSSALRWENINLSITESQISDLTHTTDTNTWWGLNAGYIYNNSNSLDFNETKLNATIDVRDSDTTYTSLGLYILLSGTQFNLNETKLNATIDARDTNTQLSESQVEGFVNNTPGTFNMTVNDLSCIDCIGTIEISDTYVLNTGDVMTGNLNMSSNNVTDIRVSKYKSVNGTIGCIRHNNSGLIIESVCTS